MEDVCIVCNRAIEWPEEVIEVEEQEQNGGVASPSSSKKKVDNNNDNVLPPTAPPMTRKSSSSSAKGMIAGGHHNNEKTQSGKKSHHHGHAHGHHVIVARGHHHATKLKRNHSNGRLLDHHTHHQKSSSKLNNLRPLTSHTTTTTNANSNTGDATVNAAVTNGSKEDTSNTTAHDSPSNAITSENLPDWMSIYCSEECRNEDELRSRLSFANLNEERRRSLNSSHHNLSSSHSRQGHGHGHPVRVPGPVTGPGSHSSLSPTLGPTHVPSSSSSASAFRRMVEARTSTSASGNGISTIPMPNVSSPWYIESEGSEFDWQQQQQQQHRGGGSKILPNPTTTTATTSHRSTLSRDSTDMMAVTSDTSEGRRFSDASDNSSSRLSAVHARQYPSSSSIAAAASRRSSSRNRGSNDSLVSIGSSGYGDPYSSSSNYGGGGHPVTYSAANTSASSSSSRPELSHRSTSALSGGLRAMTPIHDIMGPASPRLPPATATTTTSPAAGKIGNQHIINKRLGSSSSVPDVLTASSHDLSPASQGSSQQLQRPLASTSTSSIAIVSSSRSPSSATETAADAMDIPHGMTPSSLNTTATSTFVAPSSTRTFRPASISRSSTSGGSSFLKPSKSSATLALSSGDDVKATMVAERRGSPVRNGGGSGQKSNSPARRPPNALPSRSHSRINNNGGHHHTSSSSIPYLSCSPSSPGSGSINSARSNVSTDPSSSSVRGENEYDYYKDEEEEEEYSDDGEYRPLPRKHDERDAIPSLSNYGLFHQRTPSTPSLPSLMHRHQSSYHAGSATGGGGGFSGLSPPVGNSSFGARNTRLSSSYDANKASNSSKDGGSNTISTIFRERQSRPPLHSSLTSSSLRMTPSKGGYPTSTSSPRRSTFDISASYGGGTNGNGSSPTPVRTQSSGRLHPNMSSSMSSHHALYTADSTPTQSALVTRSQSFVGSSIGRIGSNMSLADLPHHNHHHEVVLDNTRDQYGRTRAPSITRTDLARVASDRSIGSAHGSGGGSNRLPSHESSSHSSSSTLQRVPSHVRQSSMLGGSNDTSSTTPDMYPVQYAEDAGHQYSQGNGARPLLSTARSKSRSSFTWDHLPSYVPQYTALDLGRPNRNKSGTSLHSVVEDEGEHIPTPLASQQSTITAGHPVPARKRLFYFPEAEDV